MVVGCLLMLGACGGGGGDSQVAEGNLACDRNISSSPNDELRWVARNMCDYYLFYQQVPEVDVAAYDDMESLIRALRVAPYDRFSYVADAAQNSALFNAGETFGYGYRLTRLQPEAYHFSLIYRDSPMAQAGVVRGDELLAIDGVTLVNNPSIDFASLLGTGTNPKVTEFTIRNAAGETRTVSVTRALYQIQTVHNAEVLQRGELRLGYLNLLHFFETTRTELNDAFTLFKEQNIEELIVDLRFNGGGRTRVAAELASYIAGNAFTGQTFSRLRYNDRYASNSVSQLLVSKTNALSLPRVVILTSGSSCSASEMVINGLRPFIEVVTIGTKTCGKPYGTLGRERLNKVMHALEVEFVNANDIGGYFDGLAPTCSGEFDIKEPFAGAAEPLLQAGVDYLQSSACAVPTTLAARTTNELGTDNPANPFDDEYRFSIP